MRLNYLFLIFILCVSNSYAYVSEYHYVAGTPYEFKYFSKRATVEAAIQICARDNATLFYPENDYEALSVAGVYMYVVSDFGGSLAGLKRSGNDYVSIATGVSVTKMYHGWKSGEPIHSDGACVFIGAKEWDVWLENIPCSTEKPFLCKRPYQIYDPAKMIREDKEVDNISSKRGVKLVNYQYVPGTHNYYKLHTYRNTFDGAKQVCEQENATLYYPETDNEAKAVAAFWEKVPHVYFPQEAFVGYRRSGGDFKTIDTSDSISKYFSNWRVGEPNNADGKEDCISMTYTAETVWFNDIPCSNKELFICKTPVVANLPETPAADAPSTEQLKSGDIYFYQYIPGTNYFYKLVETPADLDVARAQCQSEGASLFYAEDANEAKTVVDFWNAKHNGGLPETTLVGLHRTGSDFKTVDTNVSIAVLFNTWAAGEPNNAYGAEYCVSLTHKDNQIYLNDVPCHKKAAYICKSAFNLTKNAVCEAENNHEGYYFIPGTNSYYKLYNQTETLDTAIEICEREGATVFYAESKDEAKAVTTFWKSLPHTKFPSGCILGLRRASDDDFVTYDTDISINNLFHGWRLYEPNNNNNDENCVAMSYDKEAELNDIPCSTKDKFICKIKGNEYKTNAQCAPPDSDGRYGYHLIPGTTFAYKLYTTPNTLDSAAKICERENATVFYAQDEKEVRAVVQYWKSIGVEFPSGSILGFRRSGDDFLTIDTGISINNLYHNWFRGEPNNANGVESCVAMTYKPFNDQLSLNDIPCSNEEAFICKGKTNQEAATPAPKKCIAPNAEYEYTEHNGRYYKLHLWPETWEDARDKCKEEDTDLAILNSDEEAAFVVQLVNGKPKSRISGRFLRRAIYLGFYQDDYDSWVTIQGVPLRESGYDNWSDGQPDGGDRSLCGTMFFSGELNDVGCNKKALFVCESTDC